MRLTHRRMVFSINVNNAVRITLEEFRWVLDFSLSRQDLHLRYHETSQGASPRVRVNIFQICNLGFIPGNIPIEIDKNSLFVESSIEKLSLCVKHKTPA